MELGNKEGTQTLSVTDRQLLCIARALLRDCTKFIVYEEAESSPEEQDKVHSVIQNEFEESVNIRKTIFYFLFCFVLS